MLLLWQFHESLQWAFYFVQFFHWLVITYFIIHLQTGKHGIFKANINTNNMIDQRVWLVGFKWRRNGETSCNISVQNIHQLLFFNSAWKNSIMYFLTSAAKEIFKILRNRKYFIVVCGNNTPSIKLNFHNYFIINFTHQGPVVQSPIS